MGSCKGSICMFPSSLPWSACVYKVKGEGCSLPRDCSGLSSFAGGAGWRTSAGGGHWTWVSGVSLQWRLNTYRAALARVYPAGQGSNPSLCLACMRHIEHRVQFWGLSTILERIQKKATEILQIWITSFIDDVLKQADRPNFAQPRRHKSEGNLMAISNDWIRGIIGKMEPDSSSKCTAKEKKQKYQ